MVWKKGETGSKKGRSGRKSKAEELRKYIECHKEEIANETIVMLAKSHLVNKLVNYPTLTDAKELALPIYLKSVDKNKERDNPLITIEISEEVAKKNNITLKYDPNTSAENNSSGQPQISSPGMR